MGQGTGILIQKYRKSAVNEVKPDSFLRMPGKSGFYGYFQRLGNRLPEKAR
jgi:hypothetical protein